MEVTLSSVDLTEATVPLTVTIPADQETVAFEVRAVSDGAGDGTQPVTIQAVADGYVGGSGWLFVTDTDLPDLPTDSAGASRTCFRGRKHGTTRPCWFLWPGGRTG